MKKKFVPIDEVFFVVFVNLKEKLFKTMPTETTKEKALQIVNLKNESLILCFDKKEEDIVQPF